MGKKRSNRRPKKFSWKDYNKEMKREHLEPLTPDDDTKIRRKIASEMKL